MSTTLYKEALPSLQKPEYRDSPNTFCIDLEAIKENYHTIKNLHKDTAIMPIVKAMGYGAHEVEITRFLETLGVEIFGVAHPDEGVGLRRAGIRKEIFVTHTPLYEMQKIVDADLQTALSDSKSIALLQELAKNAGKILSVHLFINTGMNRFGCLPEEVVSLALQIRNSENLVLEGVCSHFSSADLPEQDAFTQKQIALFEKIYADLHRANIYPRFCHIANSSGSLRFSIPSCNLLRVGIALYGVYVSPACRTLPLKLAISLNSRISAIQNLSKGEAVSYGGKWKAPQNGTKIAIFPLGYHDGILRSYSKRGYVLVNGKKAPIVGAVCMDNTLINVTEIPSIDIGTPVLVFGESSQGVLRPEEFAACGDSIPHELLTQIGPRVVRKFIAAEDRSVETL